MLFNPNRLPEASQMLHSPRQFAIGLLAIVAVAIVLIIVLPALTGD